MEFQYISGMKRRNTSAVCKGSQHSANTTTMLISIFVGLRRVALNLSIVSSEWWPGTMLFQSFTPVIIYSVAMVTKGKM